ncbi:MAG: DEAD/DEAH box helicase [Acidimicrobiaceae bacterium]|nr:DEAD/DEAH box helicase [Acidimicrobiaceae bacterium]
MAADPLAAFSEPTRAWFASAFAAPTPPQAEGWPAIAAGDHTLVCAPTGTGKTLAAFLWAIDRLMSSDPAASDSEDPSGRGAWSGGEARSEDPSGRGTRVLYVSPLRALAVDVEKNLRAPLHGIRLAAERLGVKVHEPTVGLRTGDTSADERRRLVRHPPNILITTPESLFLMLTSRARATLSTVEHVIIDEIHAVAASKRGTHLMVSLERLEEICEHSPQRIALSATQRPLDEIARFLGGFTCTGGGSPAPRPVTVVDAGARKELDVEVVVPVADMASLGETVEAPASAGAAAGPLRRSIWPAIHPRLLELVQSHRSTLIFANARRLAERLAARLNELHLEAQDEEAQNPGASSVDSPHETNPRFPDTGGPTHVGEALESLMQAPPPVPLGDEQVGSGPADGLELVKTHHGSLSRQRRLLIEDELKRGELRGLVATSTLELGIDMGAVDLVVQVASPGSVASGLQRIGRAGHRVGEPSRGRIFPKHRADLLEAAAVVERMHSGEVEHTRYLRNPIDVAAQQIVAMCAMDDWPVERLAAVLRRSAGFAELSDEVLHSVLELLSGTYPAEEFSELRPRVVWDRANAMLRGRAGAQRLAVTNAGTIPDRGLFGVFLPDGTRVGELDEEMVYESRVGETFLLGATTWRIMEITFERVVVTPAPGELGKMPFWHGDGPGRPIELGRAVGSLVRELRSDGAGTATARLRQRCGLDETAATNLLNYLEDQAAATGAVPDDRTVVVERFRDEIGDWRVCVLTPFGAQVHAPWGVALRARLSEAWGTDVDLMWGDDGIVMRLPEAIDELPVDDLLFDPDEIGDLVVGRLPETSMFASRFRECAARALLLPRRRPDQRTPLWQQRQRAADLLSVAAKFPSFPILLETTRECLNDVFDLPALVELMADLRSRRVRVVAVDTPQASPFAQSLLFSWIAVYMYEGDAPLAERRAAALALDRDLLRDLLGAEELRELLDAGVIADVELELQRLVGGRQARDADELHDLLRILGPLSPDELAARSSPGAGPKPAGRDTAGTTAPQDGARDGAAGDESRVAVPVGSAAGDESRVAVPVGSAAGDESRVAVPVGSAAGAERAVGWVRTLVEQRRAIEVRLAGRDVVADAADAARLRDAAGAALPVGLPASATEPVEDPLGDLCVRYGRTHGPFLARDVARWLGVGEQPVAARLASLVAEGRLLRGEFRPGGADREFCDAEVLRRIRRRCLAALRQEVEPVPPEALARFLPDWQGVGGRRRGVDALADAVAQLQGAPVAASVLEADVLACRMAGYKPADLDQLCTSGEVVWVGAGALGATDGRVRLVFRDHAALLLPAAEPCEGALHDALRNRLRDRGASFWDDLVAAAQAASLPYDTETVLAALWDLVWAGEVTNDSLAPLRARIARRRSGGTRRPPVRAGLAPPRAGRSRRGRLRLGGLSATGPPSAAGRWSLVEPLLSPQPPATESALARAHQLLDRYGVVTRETALGEGTDGGFAGVYPVLKALEERGEARRGYFVAGLGAAQFALPGAVDRLRGSREPEPDAEPVVLAAIDPAQPYGAALGWPGSPGRPARTAGAHVVLADGAPLVMLERGGRSLTTFEGAESDDDWIEAIIGLVKDGRLRKLEIAKVDGAAVRETPWAARLEAAGFTSAYKGMLYRP